MDLEFMFHFRKVLCIIVQLKCNEKISVTGSSDDEDDNGIDEMMKC